MERNKREGHNEKIVPMVKKKPRLWNPVEWEQTRKSLFGEAYRSLPENHNTDSDEGDDDDDDDEVILVSEKKVVDNIHLSENVEHLSLEFGKIGGGNDVGGSSSVSNGRLYTPAEWAKVSDDDYWLTPIDNHPRTEDSLWPRHRSTPALRSQELNDRAEERALAIMLSTQRKRELRQMAAEFARFIPKEHHSEVTVSLDIDLLTAGDGPFSVALRNVIEQNVIRKSKPLIEWSASVGGCRKSSLAGVPSLVEQSMKVLAKNAAAIVSLEGIPYILRKRLANHICSLRNMNAKTLDLFVRGSATEICIQDCHWLTQDQFSTIFENIDFKNLVVLQLELCLQCNFDYVMRQNFNGSLNSFPKLVILSLRGAARLTDYAVEALVRLTPTLQSINLSQCSFLTEEGINFIADAIGPSLKEFYIDECLFTDAMLIETALLKFKNLEVLSVAGIETVCDTLVEGVVTVCGKTLKELNLADCVKLTDCSLFVISRTCSNLRSLNVSKLHRLTDISLDYIANGCQLIQSLTLRGNQFSDEAIAALLETSGMSMKNLSLNSIPSVFCNTAMALAKHSRGLLSLDLSWCRRVSNEELGLIVDSCSSLRLLKLFGCTQITDVFLNGHLNTQVRIVGHRDGPLLKYMDDLNPGELLLRYSGI